MAKCLQKGCRELATRRGNCVRHYHQLRRLIEQSAEDDEPITWELLVQLGLAKPSRQETKSLATYVRSRLAKVWNRKNRKRRRT